MTILKTLKDFKYLDGVHIPASLILNNFREEAKNWISYLEEHKELLDMSAGGFDDITDKPLEKFFKKEMLKAQIKWIKKFFNIEDK